MKRLTLKLAMGAMMAASLPAAMSAQLLREEMPQNSTAQNEATVKAVPLPVHYDRLSRAGAVTANTETPNYLRALDRGVTAPRRTAAKKSTTLRKAPGLKASIKATDITGYLSYATYPGWYSVTYPSPTKIWGAPSGMRCDAGFVRDGVLYAFYTVSNGQMLTDAGLRKIEESTGNVLEEVPFNIFDSYAEVVVSAAYDPANDVAYVVTYNRTGSATILQRYNPQDGTYTELGVTVSDENFPMAMAWNPAESTLCILTFDGDMVKYDTKARKFSTVCHYTYDFDEYRGAMTYSAKDGLFIGCVASYNEYYTETTDVVTMDMKGNIGYVSTFDSDYQWSMLHSNDRYVSADAPGNIEIKSVNVTGTATNGTITATLPSTLANGNAISGRVYVQFSIDGTEISANTSGTPGSDVNISFSSTEGLHRFTLTPYILGTEGKVFGMPSNINRYLGADTPAAPQNVTLTETLVKWSAVTTGENNGYIDASKVTYNVYIDGKLINSTPVSATQLNVTLPDNGQVSHKAAVEAMCGGKTSAQGVSSPLYSDGPLSVPCIITPEAGQTELAQEVIDMFTIVKDPLNNKGALYGWTYDYQGRHETGPTGGFYCLNPSVSDNGETANEWLFLPAVTLDDTNTYYRLSVDLSADAHAFSKTETYEIGISQRNTGARTTILREATQVKKGKEFTTSETLFKVSEPGVYYLGIHFISPFETFRLYARNFRVEKIVSSPEAPAEVTTLRATGSERGALSAVVTFNMPVKNIGGGDINASTDITATVSTEAGEVSVTGKPGAKITATVPALQGENTVKVSTSSAAGTGRVAETQVYCGVYRPGNPIVEYTVTPDNNTITLTWELDDYNENDQFAGPDDCTFTVYRRIGDDWRPAANVGKNHTWSYTNTEPNTQDIYQFGVAATNVAGSSPEIVTVGTILGKPYTLPMNETFPYSGETVNMSYEPFMIEHLSYLPASWSFVDPADIDPLAANSTGIALHAYWEAMTQITLPKFTTTGMHNVKADLSIFFGDVTPELITVYASSPSALMEPVAYFTRNDGKGWTSKLISLPPSCQNQGWVSLTIGLDIKGYSQHFMLDSYSIADYPAEMVTLSSFDGPTIGVVGETSRFTAVLENVGTSTVVLPSYTLQVLGDNGVTPLTATDAPARIDAGQKVTLNFDYTPKAADTGSQLLRFNLLGQPAGAVTDADHEMTVLNARLPIVSDLAATTSDNSVTLTWTTPKHVESFEAFEPWDYSEEMRGFRNLDLDGGTVLGIGEVSFLGKYQPKGYQVFSSTITDNPYLQARTGNHLLLAMAAANGPTSDWLISPEVAGGSEVSFWINVLLDEYPETVLVMASSTGNDPDDFEEIDGGYCCPDAAGWTHFSVKLPADARYFALWHVADDGTQQFGFLLDDLSFEPLHPSVTLESYNLYRDGELIAKELTSCGFTDTETDADTPHMYVVRSVGTVNGEKVESDRSNVVWSGDAGSLGNLTANSHRTITAGKGCVVLKGFAQGNTARVYNAAGSEIAAARITAAETSVNVAPGIYMVECNGHRAKVAVK